MFNSTRLGKFFGIDLYVHGTFWLLPLFVLFNGVSAGDLSGAAFEVVVLLALFGCVALHEVGHALAARWYGIDTRDITLYPVGGVARLERMPERPWQEIVIALAGPAVNVAIAAGLVVGIALGGVPLPTSASLGDDPAALFAWQLLAANVMLLLFNLIPAFPMDGGRVLRAVLSIGLPRLEATRAAVRVGAVIAVGFLFVGLFGAVVPVVDFELRPGNFSLILVAGVVFLLGQAELAAVKAQEARRQGRRAFAEFFTGPADGNRAHVEHDFTGWRFDPIRKVWSEWRGGVLVREVAEA